MKLIDGQGLAEKIKDRLTKDIFALQGPRPNLAIIVAGQREDSNLYVSLKEREAKKVGIDTHLYRLGESDGQKELLTIIDFLNRDESIDGILVQLPLPERFDADKIIAAIDPKKDADGFHPQHPDYVISPVLAAISASLTKTGADLKDKQILILCNSDIFGDSIVDLLQASVAKIDKVVVKGNGQEETIRKLGLAADVIISALGVPGFIKKDMVKDAAVIIDIGISKLDGKTVGDADSEDLRDKVAWLTPVPGGIGPLTIAFLFQNVWEIFRRRRGL